MRSPAHHRRLPFALVALLVVVSAAIGGGAVALATSDEGTPASRSAATTTTIHAHEQPATTTATTAPAAHTHAPATPGAPTAGGAHAGHPRLAPYAERLAHASPKDRDAADELRDQVRATLAQYADVQAALTAGYRAPRSPLGPTVHYFSPAAGHDGSVLDPSRPEGLVYYTVDGQAPVLLGAFFVAPPGVDAPAPAGDLVVWHSHNPVCAGFFATAADPCTATRRMLHVWTIDGTTLTARRIARPVAVRVTDPFGAPFGASIARA